MATIKRGLLHKRIKPVLSEDNEISQLMNAFFSSETLVKARSQETAERTRPAENVTKKKFREWIAVNMVSFLNSRQLHPRFLGIKKIEQNQLLGALYEIEMILGEESIDSNNSTEAEKLETKLYVIVKNLLNDSFRLTVVEADQDCGRIVWIKTARIH